MRRAVFLDRDGVLNEPVLREGKPHPPASVAELRIYPDAAESLEQLRAAGFLLIVVTNQPDVARGDSSLDSVEDINRELARALPLDEFRVCPHDDRDGCGCRKPLPGMILEAAKEHGIDLGASFMVGDRWRDVDAGDAAGCRTVWLDRGYAERNPKHAPEYRTVTLSSAVRWILSQVML